MIPIDLTGKVALVTGVGDNMSFAWYIGKALQAAGAKVVLACHPRMLNIGWHLRIAGRPGRFAAFMRILKLLDDYGDKVWVARRIDIAESWRTQFPA